MKVSRVICGAPLRQLLLHNLPIFDTIQHAARQLRHVQLIGLLQSRQRQRGAHKVLVRGVAQVLSVACHRFEVSYCVANRAQGQGQRQSGLVRCNDNDNKTMCMLYMCVFVCV